MQILERCSIRARQSSGEGGGTASNKNPNKGGVGKTGGKKKSKDEDLSALLSEGLSVGKKSKGKK